MSISAVQSTGKWVEKLLKQSKLRAIQEVDGTTVAVAAAAASVRDRRRRVHRLVARQAAPLHATVRDPRT